MKMARVCEILNRFKSFCRGRGWRTCESEDWIEIKKDYHNFLWTRDVHLSSFKRLASNRKCVVREGLSYHVVEPSYVAWLFSNAPSEELIRTVSENPGFSSRIAIFDLSPMLEGQNRCTKLNKTDSPVFHEFENFLRRELKVKVEPLQPFLDSKASLGSCAIPELA